jgi:hypothetical protein
MGTRSHKQSKSTSESTAAPQNTLKSRPFALQPTSERTLADVQAQLDHAQRFGHHLANFATSPPQSTTPIIQPKLTIGAPGDKYEQEADRVAGQVVQQLHSPQVEVPSGEQSVQREEIPEEDELQMKPLADQIQREEMPEDDELQMKPNGLQREEMPKEDDELQMKPMLQQQANGGAIAATTDLETAIQQSRGSGQPLADDLRQPMEHAFGNVDFSGVKVHTDAQSDQLNRSIQAKAFTTGQDIFFRQGAYQPGSQSGQELLAHELTHVVQQNGAVQRKIHPDSESNQTPVQPHITPASGSAASIQRFIMSSKDFQAATKGTLRHPRKRIAKIDAPLKKLHQSGMDHILLRELLETIEGWLAVASDESSRKPVVLQLRDQVMDEINTLSASMSSDLDPENPPPTRQRSNAFSAQVTGAGKKYGSNFSDFDSKQFRVSGRAPNRRIEEVKRTTTADGKVVYYATGLVTNFNGKAPMIAPYRDPIPLGDWYPKVTHINGMAVAPKSGLLSAAALQEAVNKQLDGQDDVALGQDAVDVLYTYSSQRGNVVVDVWDCLKGKIQIRDEATQKQEDIMLDAVHRKQRVTVSAHSRGTIKTDNAVRNAHEVLTAELLPETRSKGRDNVIAFWEVNDPQIGLSIDDLAELSFSGLAAEEAKKQLNTYVHLIYAGNAVQHPSAFIDVSFYVGGFDPISMFVGTYTETGRKLDAVIGTGGSKKSQLSSVGKTKGHGFVGNYIPSVSQEIAKDLKKR